MAKAMRLYVKYMVSERCKMIVRSELDLLNLPYLSVELGVIELLNPLSDLDKINLTAHLKKFGLVIMDDKRAILVESIKNLIVQMIHYSEEVPRVNYSDYISEKLGYDYTYLANVFSEVKGTTIQQYIIINKIERVKELLLYDELTLTEISHRMHYSSVAHLSNQFKKITGLTPTFFKGLTQKRRQNLEDM